MSKNEMKMALLIDVENVSVKYLDYIFDELSKFGVLLYKRAYADWLGEMINIKNWKESITKYSITPIHQFSYASGKNSSDMSMIIDAMDILYANKVDCFCIMSSDSDFTGLVKRLRESDKFVIGLAESKASNSFVYACDKFITLENLLPISEEKKPTESLEKIKRIIVNIIDELSSSDDDFVSLSEVGSTISKKKPNFDPRTYGFKKLLLLIQSEPFKNSIEIKKEGNLYHVRRIKKQKKTSLIKANKKNEIIKVQTSKNT